MARIPAAALALIAGLAALPWTPGTAAVTPSSEPLVLAVDATAAPSRLLRARLTIPARPGPLTLAYPRWLPGTHGPTGDITNLVNLHVRAGERDLPWQRDPTEVYAFHVEVPAGATAVTVDLEFLSAIPGAGFSQPVSFSPKAGLLRWNEVLLYPADADPDQLRVAASVRLPPGWDAATALPESGDDGAQASGTPGERRYAPASLATVIDSPVLMGSLMKRWPLAEGPRPVELVVAADSQPALEIPASALDYLRALVREADAVFGVRHFDRYQFLVTLSDGISHFGLEHHESSQNRMPERAFTDPVSARLWLDLLSHEYLHSWNGKHRRPAGLVTRGYLAPMTGELLWVYEGLTQYLAQTLAARSGLWTPERYREQLAQAAAWYQVQPGRAWRPLRDTAVGAQRFGGAPAAGSSLRRGLDYYNEGWLLWLEADVLIRDRTRGRRSLDDFLRRFAGPPSAPRTVVPYQAEDIEALLAAVAPLDWAGFFRERLALAGASAPIGGIERGGWSLVFDSTPNEHLADIAKGDEPKVSDFSFSLGLKVLPDGILQDVLAGSPAASAGLTPGSRLLAVDGRQYSPERLREAQVQAAKGGAGLELLVADGEFYREHRISDVPGPREPHLRRRPGTRDWLGAQVAPRRAR